MCECRAVVIVVAVAVISGIAPSALAQRGWVGLGSASGTNERDRDEAGSITDRDRTDAQRALFRWDDNRDGSIDRAEARRGHWSSDPFAFDANGDGRLTASELAVRYARRRVDPRETPSRADSHASASTSRPDGGDRGDDNRSPGSELPPSNSQADSQATEVYVYRTREAYERLFGDLPSWFKAKDVDLDGQLMMSEYASEWTDELAEHFVRLDPNGDGVITAKECMDARTVGGLAGNVLARLVDSPASSSSDTSESSDASDQETELGSPSPPEPPATPQEARRQMWGKLYSSKRPGQP